MGHKSAQSYEPKVAGAGPRSANEAEKRDESLCLGSHRSTYNHKESDLLMAKEQPTDEDRKECEACVGSEV
jgi:hypothetical protein